MSKIIIIDDEPMITETLSTLIEMMLDYEVVTFNHPQALLDSDILEQDIDLVISDFIMPGMDGLQLLQKIQLKKPETITILLTGYSDKDSAIKSINELGLYYYVEKPWDNNELITIIKNGIEKKQLEEAVKKNLVVIEKRNQEITRLYDLLKRDYNREMSNVLEVMISVSNLIEAKDHYTEGHTRRVAELAKEIGRAVHLPDEELKALEIAGLIHDIGKVGTPEHILNKPGKLEADEFEVMKEHPVLGYSILRPITEFASCLPMVKHHHEKLDGSGYPDGLSSDQIDIKTRIIAIVDIFDALFTKRPYRDGLPLEKVHEIMKSEAADGKIDGELVALLFEIIEKPPIKKLYES